MKKMIIRRSLSSLVAAIGITLAMLSPALPQANAAGGFVDSGIDLMGIRHATVAWGDYNNDGYLDLAVSGESEAGDAIARIYRNNGDGTFTDIKAGLSAWMVFGNPMTWGDYNNDGYLDLALCDWPYLRIYRNNGNDTFTEITDILIGTTEGSLAWGDYDNDGYLDLAVCGNTGSVAGIITRIYRNNGNGTFTDIGAGLTGVEGFLAWGDYNNDGYLDLAVCGETESLPHWFITKIYRNNGNGTFTDIGARLTEVGGGSLAWGDYDNDGYLDLAVCGSTYPGFNHITTIYRNNGDDTFTDIGAGLTGVYYNGSLAWGDYDNDGYLDLAVCGEVSSSEHITKIYKNNGNGTFTDIGAGLTGVGGGLVAWGDYDNDGDLDLALCGQASSGYITKIYKNLEADSIGNNNPNAPPSAPQNLTYEQRSELGSAILKWNPGSDAQTPASGLYYNLRVGTTSGNNNIVSGVYGSPLLGNYLRPKLSLDQLGARLKGLPYGSYYWSVQTIDTGLQASEWSDESTFILSPPLISGYVKTTNDTAISGVTMTFSGSVGPTTTDSNGCYSTIVTYGWSGWAIPSKSGYSFSPAYRSYSNVTSNQTNQNYTGSPTVVISGYVRTTNGVAIGGVTMIFSNSPVSTITDFTGYYSKAVPYGWSGAVSPVKAGYTFSPVSRTYVNVTSDQANQNYTGILQTYTISGYVKTAGGAAISGVAMTLSNGAGSTTTDSAGYYSATVTYGWSGVVTPSKSGYSFSPAYRSYSNVTSNQTNQNYTGNPTVVISGYVKTAGGAAINGVTMTITNGAGSTITDSNGYYATIVSYGWSGLVTPSKSGYTFSPVYKSYSNVTSNQTNQNYTGNPTVVISGYVKTAGGAAISGVAMTITNGVGSTTTDSNGYYSISIPTGWSGLVTPSKSGYTFSPVYRSYSNVTGNQANQNYTGSPIVTSVTISGYVKTAGGAAISGVTMTITNGAGSTTTDSNGYYSISIPTGWSGLVTPSKSGYTFSPVYRSYSNVTSNQTNQNYTGNQSNSGPVNSGALGKGKR